MRRVLRASAAAVALAALFLGQTQPAGSIAAYISGTFSGTGWSIGTCETGTGTGNRVDLVQIEGVTPGLNVWLFTVAGTRVGTSAPNNCSFPLVGAFTGSYNPANGNWSLTGPSGTMALGPAAGLPELMRTVWAGLADFRADFIGLGATITVNGTVAGTRVGGWVDTES